MQLGGGVEAERGPGCAGGSRGVIPGEGGGQGRGSAGQYRACEAERLVLALLIRLMLGLHSSWKCCHLLCPALLLRARRDSLLLSINLAALFLRSSSTVLKGCSRLEILMGQRRVILDARGFAWS